MRDSDSGPGLPGCQIRAESPLVPGVSSERLRDPEAHATGPRGDGEPVGPTHRGPPLCAHRADDCATRIPAPAPTGTHPAQGLAPSLGALSTHASVARAPTPAPVRSPNRKPCPRRECLPRLTSSTDRGPAVIPCSTPSESLSTMRSRVQETNDPTIRRTGARHLGHTHWPERGPREKGMWLAPPPQRRELRDRARSASSHSCKRAWRRGSHATGDEWTVIASR